MTPVVEVHVTIQVYTYAAMTGFILRVLVCCAVVREHTIVLLSCVVKASYGTREVTDVAG